jgi:hypothetical protein
MTIHHVPLFAIACAALIFAGCAAKQRPAAPPLVTAVDANTYPLEALGPGLRLVLFHNDQFPQSRDMLDRVSQLAGKYKDKAHFASFFWDLSADTGPYNLELLPTLVMFRDGREVDRMRGTPPGAEAQAVLDDDLELWLIKTGLGLKLDRFRADFQYRFNNSSRLHVVN